MKSAQLVSPSLARKRFVSFVPCTAESHPRTHHPCLTRSNYRHEQQIYELCVSDEKSHVLDNQQTQGAPHANHISRRSTLFALTLGILAAQSHPVRADEDVKLPKEYRQLVKRLSEGLSESIQSEASGASEAEVRRKADPAKDTVREFVRKWRDNPRVSADITHAELKEALSELGEFYMVYGQRTKLTVPVRESVLKHLSAAREALPAEPEKKGSSLLGIF